MRSMFPSDTEFLNDALAGRLERFGHPEHLRVAFAAVRAADGRVPDAVDLCRRAIRLMAARAGEPDKYHETITAAWVTLMAHHASANPAWDWHQLLEARPDLADREHLLRYYTTETLFSARARVTWVPPDVEALPRSRPPAGPDGRARQR